MAHGDKSEAIRTHAWKKLFEPEIRRGSRRIAVEIDPLMSDMEARGFPRNQPRQFCTALKKQAFLREKGLRLDYIERSPSAKGDDGRHVVLHFTAEAIAKRDAAQVAHESPHDRAARLTEKLRGILKEELSEYGGGEGFLNWIRSESDEAA